MWYRKKINIGNDYIWCKIDDIEYIVLDNPDLLKQNIAFISNVVINFCNLICDKQDLLLSNKVIDYENEYQEFLKFYNNQKEYFYSINPDIDEDYGELIDKVTNLLWWWKLETYF